MKMEYYFILYLNFWVLEFENKARAFELELSSSSEYWAQPYWPLILRRWTCIQTGAEAVWWVSLSQTFLLLHSGASTHSGT